LFLFGAGSAQVGGSTVPPGDVNRRAAGALFLASTKPPSLRFRLRRWAPARHGDCSIHLRPMIAALMPLPH